MRFRLPPLLRLLACVLTVWTAAGCGNACLELAEQICQCQPDEGNRQQCNERAREAADTFTVRPEDEAFCQAKLDENACDCRKLDTAEGKRACGVGLGLAP